MMEIIMGSGKDETMCTITMRFMLKTTGETNLISVSLGRNRLLCDPWHCDRAPESCLRCPLRVCYCSFFFVDPSSTNRSCPS